MSIMLGDGHSPSVPPTLASAFERSAHPFLMWEGLMRVPEALSGTLRPDLRREISLAAQALDTVETVHLVGCGTSYFSAIAATYAFHEIAGVPAVAHDAFEFAAYPPAGLGGAALVAVSHTGGTESVMAALAVATQRGVSTIGLTDVRPSRLAEAAAHVIVGDGGRERALPKTWSYEASLLKLYLLATEVAARRGQDVAAYFRALEGAPALSQDVLTNCGPLAERLGASRRPKSGIFILGAGPNVATASEGALKLQEAAQVPAHAWEIEEAMHGPWVTMDSGDLVVLLAFRGPGLAKAKGFAAAIVGVGAEVWAITDAAEGIPHATYETRLSSMTPECLSPLYAILPLYQLAYYTALAHGVRPDAMRMIDDRYLAARMALPR